MLPGHALEDEVADLFREAGFKVDLRARRKGARSYHVIDIWAVDSTRPRAPTLWAVECKDRSRRVPKETVVTFHGIVQDVGANWGVVVSRNGFQSGARKFAEHTNLLLLTPDELPDILSRDPVVARALAVSGARRAILEHALNALPEREKLVLTLYYFEGLRVVEVAEVLGIHPTTASRYKRRGERLMAKKAAELIQEIRAQGSQNGEHPF